MERGIAENENGRNTPQDAKSPKVGLTCGHHAGLWYGVPGSVIGWLVQAVVLR